MQNRRQPPIKLHEYKLIIIGVALIGSLLIASPAIASFVSLPAGEQFSEFFVLDSNHLTGSYPYNIVPDVDYPLYLNVGNHEGSSTHYVVYVKLLNASDTLPNKILEIPSPAEPLFEIRLLAADNQTVESPFTFSITTVYAADDQAIIGDLILNGASIAVNKPSAWNSTQSLYPYRLVFELWSYNPLSDHFEYKNQFLNLQLNATRFA